MHAPQSLSIVQRSLLHQDDPSLVHIRRHGHVHSVPVARDLRVVLVGPEVSADGIRGGAATGASPHVHPAVRRLRLQVKHSGVGRVLDRNELVLSVADLVAWVLIAKCQIPACMVPMSEM